MNYFFDDMININNLDPNNEKLDKKSYKNILIYYIGYMTPNSVKLLDFIISILNEYVRERNWE